jgi:hypothetical protein
VLPEGEPELSTYVAVRVPGKGNCSFAASYMALRAFDGEHGTALIKGFPDSISFRNYIIDQCQDIHDGDKGDVSKEQMCLWLQMEAQELCEAGLLKGIDKAFANVWHYLRDHHNHVGHFSHCAISTVMEVQIVVVSLVPRFHWGELKALTTPLRRYHTYIQFTA